MAHTARATGFRDDTPSPSERVLDAVEAEEGCSPLEFDQRLNDVIDPDALDALFQDDASTASVEFPYLGYHIVVRGDGRVSVDG